MVIASILVAALFASVLWRVSAFYRKRIDGVTPLPMQWVDGSPTSLAPPWFALALLPTLGSFVLAAVVCLIAFVAPADKRASTLAVLVLMGLMFTAIHVGHMHFATRRR